MPSIKVDFSQVKDIEPVPAGAYPLELVDGDLVEAKDASKFPYIKWTFEIDSGEFKGRKQFVNTSLSPNALWKLQEFLVAFGEDKDVLKKEFDLNPPKYIGSRVMGTIILEPYEDREVNRIDSIARREGVKAGGRAAIR